RADGARCKQRCAARHVRLLVRKGSVGRRGADARHRWMPESSAARRGLIRYPPPIMDRALQAAARSAIEGALAVAEGERVVLVGDHEHVNALDALEEAIRAVRAEPVRLMLEDLAPRPHRWLHPRIAAALADAKASVLLISFHPNELPMRNEFVDLAAA